MDIRQPRRPAFLIAGKTPSITSRPSARSQVAPRRRLPASPVSGPCWWRWRRRKRWREAAAAPGSVACGAAIPRRHPATRRWLD